MGEAVDRLEVLLSQVKAYARKTKTGKVVEVAAHEDSRLGKNFVKRSDDLRTRSQQTRSNFIHPVTGHVMGKTETGDTFEHLFAKHGAPMLAQHLKTHGFKMIAGAGTGTSRTTPLDFRFNGSHGGEVKTIHALTPNQKTAIKKEEVGRKNDAVKELGVNPVLAVQVVDPKTKTVHVYAHPAFESKSVSKMQHVGSYQYSDKDFQQAQEKSGHWDKKEARAAKQKVGVMPQPEAAPKPGDTAVMLKKKVPYVQTVPNKTLPNEPDGNAPGRFPSV